jgi:hypothetical protein
MNGVMARATAIEGTYDDIDEEEHVRDSPREMPMSGRQGDLFGTDSLDKEKDTYFCKYQSWSPHCVMILSESSRKVTTIKKRPIAGRWGRSG